MNPKKISYRCFSSQTLSLAAVAVSKGMSYRKAEQKFGIPKSTIQRKIKDIQQNPFGRPPVFNYLQESQLSKCLALAAEWGFPLTAFDVKCIVKRFLDRQGIVEARFKNNMPGKNWLKGFLKRQRSEIKIRMAHNIKRARAAVTPEIITSYFEELNKSLENVSAEAIINYDETSMQDNPGQSKVIVRRNCKYPDRIMDFTKTNFSVMFAGTASGICLPPYVVYKADNLYNTWMEGGPIGTRYNKTKSGWFEGSIFENWFETIAFPYLMTLGDCPKAIIGDNLASHTSVHILQICAENNIRFILLPPNSTHLCQPLDLAFFSPLKSVWRRRLTEWKTKNKGSVRKDQFPRLLKKSLNELQPRITENLKAGFRTSGISPINKNKVLERLPRVSTVSQAEDESASGSRWAQTFEEFLRNKREQETVVKARKKKLEVTPGKSLAELNIIENLKTKETESAKKQKGKNIPKKLAGAESNKEKNSNKENTQSKKPKKTSNIYSEDDDSSEDNCAMSLHDSSSYDQLDEDFSGVFFDDDLEQSIGFETVNINELVDSDDNGDANAIDNIGIEIGNIDKGQENNNGSYNDEENIDNKDKGEENNSDSDREEEINNIEFPKYAENEFVIVEYIYDKGTKKQAKKKFLGKIINAKIDSCTISFLRNYKGSPNVYVFPAIEDVDCVLYERIQKSVHLVSQVRGLLFEQIK